GDAASRLKTALYEMNLPAGDFLFLMNGKTAVGGVKVIAGELTFKAMNAETAVAVEKGQKVRFDGVVEEGEIAYDILLHGKKIPRGVLGKVEEMTASEKEPFKEADQKIREHRARLEKAERDRQAKEKRSGVICKAPAGNFNECAWICENNPKGARGCQTHREKVTCYRVRCNANGVWADRLNLPAEEGRSRCQAATLVEKCDY
ncbi:MAG: hypothetical protein KF789_06740, partial [Bdellovibrionaceae bacterium]|nr:hypothetical protein [Pseudobdellovibrionaceae bacterium]